MQKNQEQAGYATIFAMIVVLGAITILAFVVETGRAMDSATRLTGGADLAARSGSIQFSKTAVQETEKLYKDIEDEMKKEVEDEGVLTPDTEEFKDEVKKRSNKKLQDKKNEIISKAKSACSSKANDILQKNKVQSESISCTETEVTVKAYTNYSPVVAGSGANGNKFTRESKHKVQITF